MANEAFNNQAFQQFLGKRKLMGSKCGSCQALYLPPRPLCPNCYAEAMSWVELSGRAELRAFTAVSIATTAMIEAGYGRDNPYCAGIVQLDEGPSMSAQILGVDPSQPETIRIGTPLRVAFIDRGEGEGKNSFLAFETVS
jgi:uncharacterized OB-fold protein